MRARILGFVQALREDGLAVSVAEALDAVAAVAAGGVERPVLREALAATLVKDEADRPAFDARFDAMFPALGAARPRARKARRGGGGAGVAPPRREASADAERPGARAAGEPRAVRGDAEGASASCGARRR